MRKKERVCLLKILQKMRLKVQSLLREVSPFNNHNNKKKQQYASKRLNLTIKYLVCRSQVRGRATNYVIQRIRNKPWYMHIRLQLRLIK